MLSKKYLDLYLHKCVPYMLMNEDSLPISKFCVEISLSLSSFCINLTKLFLITILVSIKQICVEFM